MDLYVGGYKIPNTLTVGDTSPEDALRKAREHWPKLYPTITSAIVDHYMGTILIEGPVTHATRGYRFEHATCGNDRRSAQMASQILVMYGFGSKISIFENIFSKLETTFVYSR